MRVCIWHQPFDRDVSSGNAHAASQWHELCMAFGVTQLAVINETDEPFPAVNSSLDVFEINGVADLSGSIIAIEQGKFENHRAVTFPDDAWILFGGDMGIIGVDADFYTIPTPVALYPREAAAIVLENQWQLRL